MTGLPNRLTVKFWGGPKDGAIVDYDLMPPSQYYLSVQDTSEISELTPDMEFHHYELMVKDGYILEYIYRGVVVK